MPTQQTLDHSWLREARIFAFESWWPPFWPHLEVDWDKVLWTMKRLHLDTLQANALTKWACYPTKLIRCHPELKNQDLIQEAQDFCQKHGFRWIIYSLFGHPMPISTQLSKTIPAIYRPMFSDSSIGLDPGHRDTVPEEFQDYSTWFHFGDERYIAYCPFAAEPWLMEMVEEMARRYDYDAAWLDGSINTGWWGNNICICPTCQEAYEKDFNRPMPIIKDLTDARLFQLKKWSIKRLNYLLSKVVECFTKKGKVPIVGNIAHQEMMAPLYPQILKNLDGGLLEHASDQIGLVQSVSGVRQIVETSFHYLDCYDPWPRKVTSGWEVENKGLTILSYGGTPFLAQPGKYYYDNSNDEPAKRIFFFMEKEKNILSRQKRYAYCCISSLGSISSLVGAIPEKLLSFHLDCVRGWFSSMLDNHVPITDIPFYLLENKDNIQKYPVLILSDMKLMSDEMLQTVHNFLQEGGGVYLGFELAHIDDNLKDRNGELLQDLFDLRKVSLSREQVLRRHRFEGREGEMRTHDVYLKVNRTIRDDFPLPGERIHPSHFGHTVPGKSWTVVADLVPTDEDKALAPAIAFKRIGRGRVIFSSVAWGRQYYERRDPSLGRWMKDIVIWLGNRILPAQVNGSRLVRVGTTKVNQGWLIYLVNTSNDFQVPRLHLDLYGKLMQVAERPVSVGEVDVFVKGVKEVKSIYGPEPTKVTVRDTDLQIQYSNFQDHAVLHVY